MAKPGSLKKGVERICKYAVDAVEDGFKVMIFQRQVQLIQTHAPIPSLLAAAAIHHHFIRKGLRGQIVIIVEAVTFGKCIILPTLSVLEQHLLILIWPIINQD